MSNSASSGSAAAVRDDRFAALADARRRTVRRLVDERSPDGIGKDDLAHEFAAVTEDKRPVDVSADDHRRALVELHHKLLPRLTDAGLLEAADDVVRVPDEQSLDDAVLIEALSGSNRDAEAAELDALFEALADERRRRALAVLADRHHPLTTATLARAVAAAEADAAGREVSQDRVDEVRAALVHVHLPLLHEATLIGYDDESSRVSYEGHPRVRIDWIRSAGGAPTIATAGADTRAAPNALRPPFPL
ncbi:hypothetical protein HTG_06410 [Natrinema mahii]|nr:hypothetical protein HTG_06410 [Natrinema mahii]